MYPDVGLLKIEKSLSFTRFWQYFLGFLFKIKKRAEHMVFHFGYFTLKGQENQHTTRLKANLCPERIDQSRNDSIVIL